MVASVWWVLVSAAEFVAGLCAAIADVPVVFAVCVVIAAATGFWRRPWSPLATGISAQCPISVIRFVLWDVLLVALLAQSDRVSGRQVCGVAISLIGVSTVVVGALAIQDFGQRHRAALVNWRNLEVAGIPRARTTTPRSLSYGVPGFQLSAAAAIYGASIAVCIGAPDGWLVLAAIVAPSLGALFLAGCLGQWLRARHRAVPSDVLLPLVARTLKEMAPEVVLYLSDSGADDNRQLVLDWVQALELVEISAIVVVREVADLVVIAGASSRLPILAISRARDVETLLSGTVRLALYPCLDKRNDHLVRMPKIVDVLLGPVEVELGRPVSRLARMYDEVWVSGPAVRARYQAAVIDVPDETIVEIGRPKPWQPPTSRPGPAEQTRFAHAVHARLARASDATAATDPAVSQPE